MKAILLVEDNPNDALFVMRALNKARVANGVLWLRDGCEALDFLNGTGPYRGRDPSVLPAVLLLDLRMPRVSGMEVLRAVRKDPRTRELAVIILTDSNHEEDWIAGYRLGAVTYLRKPVDARGIREALQGLEISWFDQKVDLEKPCPDNRDK